MSLLLKVVGWLTMLVGIIAGIRVAKYEVVYTVDNILKGTGFKELNESQFSWTIFFTYAIGSALTGLVFLALSSILDRTEENQNYLIQVLNRVPAEQRETHKIMGSSKSSLDKAKDFKMRSIED